MDSRFCLISEGKFPACTRRAGGWQKGATIFLFIEKIYLAVDENYSAAESCFRNSPGKIKGSSGEEPDAILRTKF